MTYFPFSKIKKRSKSEFHHLTENFFCWVILLIFFNHTNVFCFFNCFLLIFLVLLVAEIIFWASEGVDYNQ